MFWSHIRKLFISTPKKNESSFFSVVRTLQNKQSDFEQHLLHALTRTTDHPILIHVGTQSYLKVNKLPSAKLNPPKLLSVVSALVEKSASRKTSNIEVKKLKTAALPDYEGPEPVQTVEELRQVFFKKTTDRKEYFRNLAMNEYWVEQSARNLFQVLDKNNDGALQLDEIKSVFDVLIRRAAKIVIGISWGLGMIVNRETKKIFNNKILPNSTSTEGADMFNLKVTIRNSLLFCSSAATKEQVDEISQHFYQTRRIDYKICHPSDIQSADVSDTISEAMTSVKPEATLASVKLEEEACHRIEVSCQ